MNRILFAAILITSFTAFVIDARPLHADQQWGDLVGRIVLKGDPPAVNELPVTIDENSFSKPILDESLVVDAGNRGIANVLVYLREKQSSQSPAHPSYEKTAKAKVQLKMVDGRFEPHVMLLRTTQTMLHVTHHTVGYHPRIGFLRNPPK